MKGQPKYKVGDNVSFTLEEKKYYGQVYIIDPYGTWDDPSDVSYDIMVENWGENNDQECLFKHITEKMVEQC